MIQLARDVESIKIRIGGVHLVGFLILSFIIFMGASLYVFDNAFSKGFAEGWDCHYRYNFNNNPLSDYIFKVRYPTSYCTAFIKQWDKQLANKGGLIEPT